MAKHLSEDEVTHDVNAKAYKAQQNIHTFSKEIDRLGERNKSLQRQMEALELAGKKKYHKLPQPPPRVCPQK